MTLKSYLRMLLAAVTLLFVTSGCNDDDDKVGPPPSYSFSVAVSDVAQAEATVTVTPSNDQATYYYAAVKKAEFDTFESDAAYAQHILDNLKAIADKKVLPLSEYLATALVKGSAPQKITDLTAGTDYYAVALGMLTDGRFTSDLVKEAFKTDDAPEPEPELELSISVTDITATTAKVSVTSSDETSSYYFDLLDEEDYQEYGGTPEGIAEFISDLLDYYQAQYPSMTLPQILSQIVSVGNDSYDFDGLTPGTKYYTFAIGVDATTGATTTTAVVKEFTTQAGSGGEGPELTLTMSAGDPEGNNLSSAVTCVIQSPTAVSGKGGLYLKANVDKALAEGTTIEEYLASDTKASTFEGRYIELINGAGLPFYAGGLSPSLAVTAIISVTDANGKTTVKSASATTASDGGETGDGPELTLTLRAGDANGANTDTKVYMGAYAPTATGAYYGVFLTSDVEKVLAQGASYDAIVTQNGTDMSTKDGWLDGLVQNPGIGVTFSGLDPATSYTCILKVTDSAGKSTTKHVAATTEGGGEASDAYKAWLGTWTLTSTSSEVNAAPLSFDVTFIQGVANSSYKLQGWGITTIRDQSQILPLAKFDSATGNFEILEGQSLYTDPEDGSVLTLTGRALLQGKYYIINGGYPGFTGKLNADKNSATITLYQGSVEGMGNFTTSSMDFFWVLGQDIYWQKAAEGYTDKDYPIGPYTMTRKSAGASVSASKSAATILHASKLSSVLSGCTVLSTSVKQNGVVFESQVAMPSSLVFDRPAAVYEASVGNVANIKKPLGLKKHFIKK